jgi:hypothetical protein
MIFFTVDYTDDKLFLMEEQQEKIYAKILSITEWLCLTTTIFTAFLCCQIKLGEKAFFFSLETLIIFLPLRHLNLFGSGCNLVQQI